MNILQAHILFSLIGEAILAISLLVGVLYGLQSWQLKRKKILFQKFPPLELLDRYQIHFLMVGFLSLSIGITLGAMHAIQVVGVSWVFQPRQIWMFLGWFVYGGLIQWRRSTGFRGKKLIWYSTIGFALVLFSGWLGLFGGFYD